MSLNRSLGFDLQDYRGLHAKTRASGLISKKSGVSLKILSREGVSGALSHQISDRQSITDPSASARGRTTGADRWARGVGDLR
jgi:hypothetical protein